MEKTSSSKAVLIVDDQEAMCWILSKILSSEGYSVCTAHNVAQALAAAQKVPISAAIIDYRLPDGSGFDLLAALRPDNPQLVAILITSYGSKELCQEALSRGFEAYFDKPFRNQALLEVLANGLGSPRTRKERKQGRSLLGN